MAKVNMSRTQYHKIRHFKGDKVRGKYAATMHDYCKPKASRSKHGQQPTNPTR